MTNLRIHNSMSGRIEEVTPRTATPIGVYACGPTVYSYAHIGNFRSFLTADLIVRTLAAQGHGVRFVSNITDVGHLTNDEVADSGGEDKMERALRSSEGERFANIWDLARSYADAFLEDWDALSLTQPFARPRATEHVTQQINQISRLIELGAAYETDGGVYFHVPAFPNYGKLSRNVSEEALVAGSRELVEDRGKRDPRDFALWKKDERHLMRWHSPWGWGYPGWHIECSAMAMEYLGETVDIHTGGIDNKFPHHECEIAQSESFSGKTFARFWVHTGHLQVDGARMAKSSGNFYTVRDLVGKDAVGRVAPGVLRWTLISAKYREPFNFTRRHLSDVAQLWDRLQRVKERATAAISETAGDARDGFERDLSQLHERALGAMSEDLNTPVALAALLDGASLIQTSDRLNAGDAQAALAWLGKMDDLLGVIGMKTSSTAAENHALSDHAIEAKLQERRDARGRRDYAAGDRIRDELEAQGIEISDSAGGTSWRRRASH